MLTKCMTLSLTPDHVSQIPFPSSKRQKEDGRPLSRLDELGKLSSLYEKGVLTIEEFENEKKKILSN